MIDDLWYKNAVIYSLNVGTFMDSNGDGVGDFVGLTDRLPYLAGLGVTCLWLLPFLTSPSSLLLVVWTVSIIPTYVMWHLSARAGAWGTLPAWVMLLEYGCVASAAAIIAVRKRWVGHSNRAAA